MARRIENHPAGERPVGATVTFTCNGEAIEARAGESLAAALLLAGVRTLRTMPDGESPRGLFCDIGRCTDCLMVVDDELSVRSCVTPVRDGMVVETQFGLGVWKVAEHAAG